MPGFVVIVGGALLLLGVSEGRYWTTHERSRRGERPRSPKALAFGGWAGALIGTLLLLGGVRALMV